MSIKNLLVASLLLLYFPSIAQANIQNIEPSIQQAALRKVSKKTRVPVEKLEIVYSYQPTFQAIGKKGFGFIIIRKSNGQIFDITVDASGKEMDLEKLAQQDTKAYAAKYGKLSQGLFKRLASAKPNDQISVVIKLKVARKEPTESIENEQVVNQAINKIEELGFNVTGDNSSPAVYGNLTPAQIGAIEKLDIVDSIQIDPPNPP
jgi:hypothetical protein